ncbi:MAG: hypothetical protein ACK5BV_03630 [Bacteroidota bacterium]|jgi:hypothetical protein
MTQNTVELMNILSLCSKSKTNKDLAKKNGFWLVVIGGICLYYYYQNHTLRQLQKKHTGLLSEMSSQLSSLKESNGLLQNQINKLNQTNNNLIASLKKLESNSNKEELDRS